MISSVLNLNRQTVQEILTFELGMQKIFVPSWSQKFSPMNRRNERIFGQKRYFSGSAATILA
jgi:hypothetical protein